MELTKYIYPIRKWWWLLLAATLVAAVSSFLATMQQPDIYQTRTTLMIGRAIEDPNPSSAEFFLSQQLAATYADIASRDMVRNATMQSLGMTWLPEYNARALPNNQFIEIVVTDVSPERARTVANELANQLILLSPTSGGSQDDQNRQAFINQQLDSLETQIKQTTDEVQRLQAELGNLVSARQILDSQNQIAALQTKLAALQSNYAMLLANTRSGASNTLSVIEPAGLPKNPIGPNNNISVILAAAIGFVLAAGAAYLLEFMDDTLKTPEDVNRLLNLPVIGYIAEVEKFGEGVYVADHPRSPVAEAFRSLRTNLEFAGVDVPLNTILVTSADTGVGKTSVAINLAVAIAQSDKKVVLIDADLRRPSVHLVLGMSNRDGLSDVFRGRIDIQDVGRAWRDGNLAVITTGAPPPNPTELLGSMKMDTFLSRLGEVADVVIIDGPPFLVADAAVLAAKVDGVLLVARPGYTRQGMAKAMMEQIQRSGARVLGVTLNRIPPRNAEYFGGFQYYSPYYADQQYYGKGRARTPIKQTWIGRLQELFKLQQKP